MLNEPMAHELNKSTHTNEANWTRNVATYLEAGLYGPNPINYSPNKLNLYGLQANPWTNIHLGQLVSAFSCLLTCCQATLPLPSLRLHLYLDWMTKSICEFVTSVIIGHTDHTDTHTHCTQSTPYHKSTAKLVSYNTIKSIKSKS